MHVRLSQHEISSIKESIHTLDPDAKIYLFGSRADPSKKGGDIDFFEALTSRFAR